MIFKSMTWFFRGKCFLVMFFICTLFPFLCTAEDASVEKLGSIQNKSTIIETSIPVKHVPPAEDSPIVSIVTATVKNIELIQRRSTIIETSVPVGRVSLADEEIADALVLTPQTIYLTGKGVGMTRLTLWDETDEIISFFDLEVSPEIIRLKEELHIMFPDEEDIRVTASHEDVTLSGTVSNASILSQVLSLAQSYATACKFEINNFLEVGGVQQVMLEVRIAEMSRSTSKRMGINFNYATQSGKTAVQGINNLTDVTNSSGVLTTTYASNVNLIFNFMRNGAAWTMFIDAIKEEGLIRILAEPTLITLSGKTAQFLAGGEYPVPVPQTGNNSNTITIEYKPYGVGLNFTPTVLSNGRISMEIAPEVSELDFSNSVSLQGFVIPGLTTRRISTVVELSDGQNFAIAGLLNDRYAETVSKYPFLGDLPIIGSMFR